MRELTFKFFSIFVAFANFFGNIAYSFSKEAVKLAVENAKRNENVRYIFNKEIPCIEISTMLGWSTEFHSVEKYCFLLDCKKEDLEHLLKGKICGNYVDKEMINDFMVLARVVRSQLCGDCLVGNGWYL